MEPFLPSEVARLVLGYLKEEGCIKSHATFLVESKHLAEYRSCLHDGRVCLTTVAKKTLKMILFEYGRIDNSADEAPNSIEDAWFSFDAQSMQLKRISAMYENLTHGSKTARSRCFTPLKKAWNTFDAIVSELKQMSLDAMAEALIANGGHIENAGILSRKDIGKINNVHKNVGQFSGFDAVSILENTGRSNARRQTAATKQKIAAARMPRSSSSTVSTPVPNSSLFDVSSHVTPYRPAANVTMPVITSVASSAADLSYCISSSLHTPITVSGTRSACDTLSFTDLRNYVSVPSSDSTNKLVSAASVIPASEVMETSFRAACSLASEMHDLSTLTTASLHVVTEDSSICPNDSVMLCEESSNVSNPSKNAIDTQVSTSSSVTGCSTQFSTDMPILASGVVPHHNGEIVSKLSNSTHKPSTSVDMLSTEPGTQLAVCCEKWLGLNSNGNTIQEIHSEPSSGGLDAQQAVDAKCTFSSTSSNSYESLGLYSGHGQDTNADSDIYEMMRNRYSLTSASVLSAESETQLTVIGEHCIDASTTLEVSRLGFGPGTSDEMNPKSSLFSTLLDQSGNDSGYLFERGTPVRNKIPLNIEATKTPDKTCRSLAFENHQLKSFKSPRRKCSAPKKKDLTVPSLPKVACHGFPSSPAPGSCIEELKASRMPELTQFAENMADKINQIYSKVEQSSEASSVIDVDETSLMSEDYKKLPAAFTAADLDELAETFQVSGFFNYLYLASDGHLIDTSCAMKEDDDDQPDVEFGPRKAHSTPDNEKPPALHYDLDSSHIPGTQLEFSSQPSTNTDCYKLSRADRMHTPEIAEQAADETMNSSNNPCRTYEAQVPNSGVTDLTLIESLHQSVDALALECVQDSSVLQSTMISCVREHASDIASPIFDRRHIPLKHSELTACSVQLFNDNDSNNVEKSASIPQQSSANNSTVFAGNRVKSDPVSQRSLLPKIVPVVYFNSEGKPTRYELIQPVPSPSYFSGSTPLDDTDTAEAGRLAMKSLSSFTQKLASAPCITKGVFTESCCSPKLAKQELQRLACVSGSLRSEGFMTSPAKKADSKVTYGEDVSLANNSSLAQEPMTCVNTASASAVNCDVSHRHAELPVTVTKLVDHLSDACDDNNEGSDCCSIVRSVVKNQLVQTHSAGVRNTKLSHCASACSSTRSVVSASDAKALKVGDGQSGNRFTSGCSNSINDSSSIISDSSVHECTSEKCTQPVQVTKAEVLQMRDSRCSDENTSDADARYIGTNAKKNGLIDACLDVHEKENKLSTPDCCSSCRLKSASVFCVNCEALTPIEGSTDCTNNAPKYCVSVSSTRSPFECQNNHCAPNETSTNSSAFSKQLSASHDVHGLSTDPDSSNTHSSEWIPQHSKDVVDEVSSISIRKVRKTNDRNRRSMYKTSVSVDVATSSASVGFSGSEGDSFRQADYEDISRSQETTRVSTSGSGGCTNDRVSIDDDDVTARSPNGSCVGDRNDKVPASHNNSIEFVSLKTDSNTNHRPNVPLADTSNQVSSKSVEPSALSCSSVIRASPPTSGQSASAGRVSAIREALSSMLTETSIDQSDKLSYLQTTSQKTEFVSQMKEGILMQSACKTNGRRRTSRIRTNTVFFASAEPSPRKTEVLIVCNEKGAFDSIAARRSSLKDEMSNDKTSPIVCTNVPIVGNSASTNVRGQSQRARQRALVGTSARVRPYQAIKLAATQIQDLSKVCHNTVSNRIWKFETLEKSAGEHGTAVAVGCSPKVNSILKPCKQLPSKTMVNKLEKCTTSEKSKKMKIEMVAKSAEELRSATAVGCSPEVNGLLKSCEQSKVLSKKLVNKLKSDIPSEKKSSHARRLALKRSAKVLVQTKMVSTQSSPVIQNRTEDMNFVKHAEHNRHDRNHNLCNIVGTAVDTKTNVSSVALRRLWDGEQTCSDESYSLPGILSLVRRTQDSVDPPVNYEQDLPAVESAVDCRRNKQSAVDVVYHMPEYLNGASEDKALAELIDSVENSQKSCAVTSADTSSCSENKAVSSHSADCVHTVPPEPANCPLSSSHCETTTTGMSSTAAVPKTSTTVNESCIQVKVCASKEIIDRTAHVISSPSPDTSESCCVHSALSVETIGSVESQSLISKKRVESNVVKVCTLSANIIPNESNAIELSVDSDSNRKNMSTDHCDVGVSNNPPASFRQCINTDDTHNSSSSATDRPKEASNKTTHGAHVDSSCMGDILKLALRRSGILCSEISDSEQPENSFSNAASLSHQSYCGQRGVSSQPMFIAHTLPRTTNMSEVIGSKVKPLFCLPESSCNNAPTDCSTITCSGNSPGKQADTILLDCGDKLVKADFSINVCSSQHPSNSSASSADHRIGSSVSNATDIGSSLSSRSAIESSVASQRDCIESSSTEGSVSICDSIPCDSNVLSNQHNNISSHDSGVIDNASNCYGMNGVLPAPSPADSCARVLSSQSKKRDLSSPSSLENPPKKRRTSKSLAKLDIDELLSLVHK